MAQHPGNIQNNEDNGWLDDEQRLEASLRAALHRQGCPDTMTLGEYQLGLLAASETAHLVAHLDRCPYCQAELNRLTEFLAEESPVVGPAPAGEEAMWTQSEGLEWQRLKKSGQVLIRLMAETLEAALANFQQGLQPPPGQLALGNLRGKGDQRLLELALPEVIYDFEAIITIDTSWRDPMHCAVIVDVNIPSLGGWPHLRGTEVALKRDEQKVATQTTNAFGRVVFGGIATADLTKFTFEITPPASG